MAKVLAIRRKRTVNITRADGSGVTIAVRSAAVRVKAIPVKISAKSRRS